MQQIGTVSEHIHIVQAVEQVRISTKDDEHVLQDLPNPDLIPESDLQFEKMQPIPLISEVMEDRFTGVPLAQARFGSARSGSRSANLMNFTDWARCRSPTDRRGCTRRSLMPDNGFTLGS